MIKLFGTEIKSSDKLPICPICESDQFDGEFCGNCYKITAINRSQFGGKLNLKKNLN